ncbi:hypothetical protein [Sorangium sp. So ce887]|uniref:hypothetical protein n=1 Tax=Sorangium sp. So ce887 TaxID=3133324 RepID=UPI003F6169B6
MMPSASEPDPSMPDRAATAAPSTTARGKPEGRPPHPATVVQAKPQPKARAERPPHPATVVQAKPQPKARAERPPHPATVVQAKPQPKARAERPLHPATVVQARSQPKARAERPPHPATAARPAAGGQAAAALRAPGEGPSPPGEDTAQPLLAAAATVAALAWGTAYLRDSLFGSSELPRRGVRNDDMVDAVAQDYTVGKGLQVTPRTRTRIVVSFGRILTVNYDTNDSSFNIGEIERPKGVKYFASDILEFAFRQIEAYLNKGPLPLALIRGAGIVNQGTAWIANFPGVQALSWLVSGTLSVDVGRQTPLGKMIEHFLADYHPDLFMKSITVEPGPQSNARNTVVKLGTKE